MSIIFLVSFVLVSILCQSISAEEQVIRNDTANNNKLYQDAKKVFVRLMKRKIVNQNEYLKHCELSTSIEEAKQSALQEFDSKRLDDDDISKEYREKLKQDLNYFQLLLNKLWIFYSESLHQYSDLMQKSSGESYVNTTELQEIHKKAKMKAIEEFQKNTDSSSVFKLSVQRRLENTIEEEKQFSRLKEQNDRIFTEMTKLHNERIIAEIIEGFDDQMVTEMPDIYFYNPFEYAIKKAMKDFDAKKLGGENLSNRFREKLVKVLHRISERLLRLAVRTGNANAVNYLVKMGFDVNAKDRKELTLLHGAASGGYEKVVEALIKERADVNAKEFYGWTPFHSASSSGHLNIVKMLIENGTNVNARTERNKTGLHLAVQNGHEKLAEFLIDNGIDVNSRDENGISPIFLPIYSSLDMIDRENIILMLIKKGANVNLQDDRGRVPIHNVANLGYDKLFEILVQNSANTTVKDLYGSTALMLAARQGHEKIINFLIQNGSDVNAKDNEGSTALILATYLGNENVVEILLKNGADVNAKDNVGWTVLHKVARAIQESSQENVAKLLIQHGANVNAEDNRGERPLQTAAFYGRKKLVEIFLKNGADVNARDKQNGTALHSAAYYGYKDIVQILLKNGADKTIQNDLGATPVEVNRKVFESNPNDN